MPRRAQKINLFHNNDINHKFVIDASLSEEVCVEYKNITDMTRYAINIKNLNVKSQDDSVQINDVAAYLDGLSVDGSVVSTTLSNEIVRATFEEGVLSSDLSTELVARADGDDNLSDDLSTEVSRATLEENVLSSDLSTELVARADGDSSLTDDLSTEVSRATLEEGVLSSD